MALFKKLISAVKKLFRGKSSRRKKRKSPAKRRKLTIRRKTTRLRQKKIPGKKKTQMAKKKKTIKPAVPKRQVLKFSKVSKSPPAKPLSLKPSEAPGILTGEITHYFSKISVVVIKMSHGSLTIGNRIRIQGKGADFVQKVGSLQIESQDVKVAPKGQLVGLKVIKPAKPGDKVFKLPS